MRRAKRALDEDDEPAPRRARGKNRQGGDLLTLLQHHHLSVTPVSCVWPDTVSTPDEPRPCEEHSAALAEACASTTLPRRACLHHVGWTPPIVDWDAQSSLTVGPDPARAEPLELWIEDGQGRAQLSVPPAAATALRT